MACTEHGEKHAAPTPPPAREALSRQAWQAALDERFGRDLRERFERARVAICGLGGLGSNVAIALARSGVGTLELFDFDCVDVSNLNRQQYEVSQLGMPKTQALSENLARIAPYCKLEARTLRIQAGDVAGLFHDADVVCECFDNPEAKAMLVQGVLEAHPGKPIVAASGMAGLGSANAIRTRKVGSSLYLCGDGTSDAAEGLGLVSSRVLACAAHEAHMVLRLLAGETEV